MTQPTLFGDVPEPPVRKAAVTKEPVDLPPAGVGLLRAKATTCRSCNAAIVMAYTIKKVKGRDVPSLMPVNLDPAPGGNVRLTMEGRRVRAYVIGKAQTVGRATLHVSHFATCPDAKNWRKPK